ncbi:MAG: preprotein translocase subunit SecE [Pyrinomonadaceae bacterium MAG19_C2-C3]|nr:preprotein translocase subunit SecE [Pyrinomonadaceae bacterium MAG19_C2-C3]
MSTKDDQIPTEIGSTTAESGHEPARISSIDTEQSVASTSKESRSTAADSSHQERHGKKEAGFVERTGNFIRETRAEMRRVDWPSAKEVKNTTIITLIAVIFFALYLYAVDQSFTFLIAQLSRLLGWLISFVV